GHARGGRRRRAPRGVGSGRLFTRWAPHRLDATARPPDTARAGSGGQGRPAGWAPRPAVRPPPAGPVARGPARGPRPAPRPRPWPWPWYHPWYQSACARWARWARWAGAVGAMGAMGAVGGRPRRVWDHEVAGSSPAAPTEKPAFHRQEWRL